MSVFRGPGPLILSLVILGMRLYRERRRKRRELERLARKPARVQPYFPENSAYYQPTPSTKRG